MPSLARKTQKLFGGNFAASPSGVLAQFGSLAAAAPIYSADPAVIQALSAFLNGWSAATIPIGSPPQPVPPEQDFNALFYLVTYQLQYILDRGVPEYDSGTTYGQYSFCQVNGHIYRSNVNNNTGNNPPSSPTQWTDYQALFDAAGAAAAAQSAAIAAAAADATTKANAAQAAAIAASDPAGTAAAAVAAYAAGVLPQLVKAYAYFNGGPFATPPFGCPIYHSFNCNGITCTAAGEYTFDFITAMPGVDTYLICGNCGVPDGNNPFSDPGFNNVICGTGTRNAAGFSFGAWEPRLEIFEYCSGISVWAI